MRRSYIKRIFFTILFVLSFFIMNNNIVKASDAGFSSAKQLVLGNNYNEYFSWQNTSYYKFTTLSSGKINIKFVQPEKLRVRVELYNSDFEKVDSLWVVETSTMEWDLIPDTYYLKIYDSSHYGDSGSFIFKTSFINSNESCKTDNSNYSGAYPIAIGNNYNGNIEINRKEDIYKFTLGKNQKISLNYYPKYYDDDWDLWAFLSLYNSDYEKLDRQWVVAPFAEQYVLKKGTYYFVVSGDHSNGNNTGNYSFKISSYKQSLVDYKLVLSKNNYTYTGKQIVPSVKIISNTGETLKLNRDFTVTYKNNKNPGTAQIIITGKGDYIGSRSMKFSIKPKGTKITKISAKSKGFSIKWKKQSVQTSGYQVQYSTKKKFVKAKTIIIKRNKITSLTKKKLKSKKKYYVRIRSYKLSSNKKYYSNWSVAKTMKTRK